MLVFLTGFFFSNVYAVEKKYFPVTPKTNKGQKWRIGYLEGGPYENYPDNLRALVTAFSDLGWAKKIDFPPPSDATDTKNLWVWISQNVKSDYLEFVPDAYWSDNWDKEVLRPANKKAVIERLNGKKDIDLMLAMGTWAGQDLANNEHSVPTIVMSTSNPIASKISKSVEDSGYDHLNARVDPTRYERQTRIFYDIIHFKNLGVVLENTVEGRTYAAIDDVEKVAKELGFNVNTCHAPFSDVPQEVARNSVMKCHEELSKKCDAVYITVHRGVTLPFMPQLTAPFLLDKIPTFSQRGTDEVKYGALLSIARAGFKYVARFHAETIAKIFNGAKPRDLEQLFEDPPRIAINLKTAQIIGYDPTIDVLGFSDEVFEDIAAAR